MDRWRDEEVRSRVGMGRASKWAVFEGEAVAEKLSAHQEMPGESG